MAKLFDRTKEQVLADLEAWAAKRPIRPTKKRPQFEESYVIFGIGIPVLILAVVLGVVFSGLAYTYKFMDFTVSLLAIVVFPIVGMLVCVMGPEISNSIRRPIYLKRMESTGWRVYEEELEAWRIEFYKANSFILSLEESSKYDDMLPRRR